MIIDGVLQASFAGPTPPAWLLRAVEDGVASVCLYGDNAHDPERLRDICTALHEANERVVVAADEEGGDVTRLEWSTGSSYPGNAALGAVDDIGLTAAVGAAIGADLVAADIDLNLAPVLDVNTAADNPVIGVRSFGSDPELVARHGAAFIRGLQSAGVAACAKHFPGHGAATVDSHIGLPTLDIDETTLRTRELVPFRAAIDAGVAAVMTAHIVVGRLDDRPATLSPVLLRRVLRDELGFEGVVVSDALDMGGISAGSPRTRIPAAAVGALAAGADLLCLGPGVDESLLGAVRAAVAGALRDGTLDENALDRSATRVAKLVVRSRPGALVAERALRIRGELQQPVRGAHVVELGRPANIAAGDVPWGLAAALQSLDPSTTATRDPDADAALAAANGRPLVIVVRDPHRFPDQMATLRRLTEARPDAVVVDMGWPTPANDLGTAAHVTTFGASRASAEAVARLLHEADRSTTNQESLWPTSLSVT